MQFKMFLILTVFLFGLFEFNLACWNGSSPHLYGGSVKWTENGRICQQWTSQTPHKHINNKDSQFPTDGSAAGALNYCRDPDGTGFLWCYTVNSEIRWEKCDVPICDVDCYRETESQQYKGTVAQEKNGRPCMAWSEQTPHKHKYNKTSQFPNDANLIATNNYCRDPDHDGRPWCYTMSPSERWEYCDIPKC